MKKSYRILSLILSVLLCTFLFVGCGETPATSSGDTSSGGASSGGDDKFVVYAPLSGELGDESFMDSANRGLEWARDRLGCEVRVIPASTDDPQAWDRNLREAAQNESVDLIVTGGTVVATTLEEIAPDFPNKPFIIFDAESNGDNVTGIVYKQNEGAFLAGALAALITKNADLFPNATGSNRVAIVGGEDILSAAILLRALKPAPNILIPRLRLTPVLREALPTLKRVTIRPWLQSMTAPTWYTSAQAPPDSVF